MKIAAGFAFRRLLTGSPVTKSPLDLYGQTEFLRPGLLGFDSFYAFQGRYAVLNKRTMGAKSFQQIVGYKNLEELTWRVDQFSFRVLKKDCLDLPEKTYTARYVTLTAEQRAMYESIQSQAMHLFENGQMVTAPGCDHPAPPPATGDVRASEDRRRRHQNLSVHANGRARRHLRGTRRQSDNLVTLSIRHRQHR
jgi:SNF2 family DNA or RNA helicase